MARPALLAKDQPEHQVKVAEKAILAESLAPFIGKPFEKLSPSEKDALLKAMALKLGLIREDA